jgi:hypothetical protein
MRNTKPCTHTELTARVVALETGLVALRQVLDERDERYKLRASSQDAAVKTAMDASEKALVKAESGTERRLESLNELRSMASDQAALLMPRSEYAVQHQALVDRVTTTESRINTLEGRGGGIKEMWGYIIAIAAIIVAGIIEFVRH